MFIVWSTFKILCYQRSFPRALEKITKEYFFCFLLSVYFLGNTSRPAKVTKDWRISLVPSHMEHLVSSHDFFHCHSLRKKKKIWQRWTVYLWFLGCCDRVTPSGSFSNKAEHLYNLLLISLSFTVSGPTVMAPLYFCPGILPSPLFCYLIFPSVHLFIHISIH